MSTSISIGTRLHERQLRVVFCRSWFEACWSNPTPSVVRSNANDWSGRMQTGGARGVQFRKLDHRQLEHEMRSEYSEDCTRCLSRHVSLRKALAVKRQTPLKDRHQTS